MRTSITRAGAFGSAGLFTAVVAAGCSGGAGDAQPTGSVAAAVAANDGGATPAKKKRKHAATLRSAVPVAAMPASPDTISSLGIHRWEIRHDGRAAIAVSGFDANHKHVHSFTLVPHKKHGKSYMTLRDGNARLVMDFDGTILKNELGESTQRLAAAAQKDMSAYKAAPHAAAYDACQTYQVALGVDTAVAGVSCVLSIEVPLAVPACIAALRYIALDVAQIEASCGSDPACPNGLLSCVTDGFCLSNSDCSESQICSVVTCVSPQCDDDQVYSQEAGGCVTPPSDDCGDNEDDCWDY